MNWFLPALGATVLWGVGQTLIKRGLQGISPFVSNFIAVISVLAVEIPFALIGGVNWDYFPGIFLFGFFASAPNCFFPYVLKKANVSLSGTVLATYPIYTITLSILFLGEPFSLLQAGGWR